MKKIRGKVKRTLSVVLAAAMILTMLPQTSMAVYANEIDETIEPATDVYDETPSTPDVYDAALGEGDETTDPVTDDETDVDLQDVNDAGDGVEDTDTPTGIADEELGAAKTDEQEADDPETDEVFTVSAKIVYPNGEPSEDARFRFVNDLADWNGEEQEFQSGDKIQFYYSIDSGYQKESLELKSGEDSKKIDKDAERDEETHRYLYTVTVDGNAEIILTVSKITEYKISLILWNLDEDYGGDYTDTTSEVELGGTTYRYADRGPEDEPIETGVTIGIDNPEPLKFYVKPGDGLKIGSVRVNEQDIVSGLDAKPSEEKEGYTEYTFDLAEYLNNEENPSIDGDEIGIWVETRSPFEVTHTLMVNVSDGDEINDGVSIYKIEKNDDEYKVTDDVYDFLDITEDSTAYIAIVVNGHDADEYIVREIYGEKWDDDTGEYIHIPVSGELPEIATINVNGTAKTAWIVSLTPPGMDGMNLHIDLVNTTISENTEYNISLILWNGDWDPENPDDAAEPVGVTIGIGDEETSYFIRSEEEIESVATIKRDGPESFTFRVKPDDGLKMGSVRVGGRWDYQGLDVEGIPNKKTGYTEYTLSLADWDAYLENDWYEHDYDLDPHNIKIYVEPRHAWNVHHDLKITWDGYYYTSSASIYEITENDSGGYKVLSPVEAGVTLMEDETAYYAIVVAEHDANTYKVDKIYTETWDGETITVGEEIDNNATILVDGEPKSAKIISLTQPGGTREDEPFYIALVDLAGLTYSITFDYDNTKVNKPVIEVDDTALADDKWSDMTATVPGVNKNVTFTVDEVPESRYKIDKVSVKADDDDEYTELVPDAKGVYTLGKVDDDITVKIDAVIDESKANKLTLSSENPVDSNAYTVKFYQAGENDFDEGIKAETTYKLGDKIVTLTPSFYAVVTPDDGYEIGNSVIYSSKNEKAEVRDITSNLDIEETLGFKPGEKDKVYRISYSGTEGDDLVVKFTVSAVAVDKEQTILFANKSTKLTYKVNAADIVLKPGTSDTYVAKEGASALDFTVTANNGYEPKVSYVNKNGKNIDADYTKAVPGKSTTQYSYIIAVASLPDDAVITLVEEVVQATVSVNLIADDVEIASARIGAKALTKDDLVEPENDADHIQIKVPHGETLTIAFAALDNCRIIGIGQTGKKKVSTKATKYEVSITADAVNTQNPEIKVESEKLYRAELYDAAGKALEAVNNVYTVDYSRTYTTKVRYGRNAFEVITVEVKNGSSDVTDTVVIPNPADKTAFKIDFSKDTKVSLMGKTLTVNLLADGEIVANYRILPVPTKVEVIGAKNVDGKLTITQAADTVKKYDVKVTPNTVNVGEIKAEVSGLFNDYIVDLTDGVLTVTTPQEVNKTTMLSFYTEIPGVGKRYLDGTAVTLASSSQLDSVKPTLKLDSSDDTSLTLTLGAPQTVVQANEGKVYYAVTVESVGKAKTTDGTKESEIKGNVEAALDQITGEGTHYKTFYTPYNGELTQKAIYTVNNAGRGRGAAWLYKVTVQLVQTKEPMSDGAAVTSADSRVLSISKSVDSGKSYYETKNPYYEDKLKLTKGTTTIYTGQKVGKVKDGNIDMGVLIATPKFGTNTTYAKITRAVDATYDDVTKYSINEENSSDGTNGALELKVDPGTNKVYAKAHYSYESVGKQTKVGKHKVIVYAETAPGAQPATATIDITVVQGIEELSVSVPSDSLYKADKKTATLKATVNYPGTPKTKKVTWDIVGEDGTKASAPAGVTVKNGTVTVEKKYVVSSDNNKFRVKVTAADYAGNDGGGENVRYALSSVITITSHVQPIGNVVLAREVDGHYELVAKNGDAKTAEELQYVSMYVLKKGTPETPTFTDGDILDKGSFTFTSNNKAVAVDVSDGNIYSIKKPVKNVKLTATANDGSKAKATMTVTVNYAKTAETGEGELALKLWTEYPSHKECYALENPSMTLEYDGTMGTIVYAEVLKRNAESGWDIISDYTNFKVTATNAKVFTLGQYNEWLQIVTTKKNADIKLTYTYQDGTRSASRSVTYHLVNNGFDKVKAPKVTLENGLVTDKPMLVQGIITNLASGDSFNGKVVLVEVDLSAANAKTLDNYMDLSYALQNPQECNVDSNGEFKFNLNDGIRAGSYKLKFTVGHIDKIAESDPTFIPDYQAKTVTVKATAPKALKGSFKLTAKYTLSLAASKAKFTDSRKQLHDVTYDSTLLNAYVKGQSNAFTTYFKPAFGEDGEVIGIELDTDAVKAGVEAGKTLNEIIGKDNLTGYVTYTASYGTGTAYTKVTETVKITITLK